MAIFQPKLLSCCLLIASASVLGCSKSADIIASKLNACLIVTEADVESAIGTPVASGVRQSDRQCLYHAKDDPQQMVTVELDAGEDDHNKTLFHKQRAKTGHQPVPGIGDGAFTVRSPIGGIQLVFLKDDALVTLSLFSSKQSNPQATVTHLAKVAATRIPGPRPPVALAATASVADTSAMSSFSQWTGDWYGCVPIGMMYGKGHLTLSDHADWTLTTAVVMPGTLVADRGQWQAESYQEILHGTYQVTGKDRFSTTGILNVTWNRLANDQAPSKFDPLLWQSFGTVPRRMAVKRLTPVEPGLIGTWEGSARFVDRREEFVWTITSANVSEFYRATTQSGRIEPEQDHFKLIPAQGKTAPLLMRIQGPDKMELTENGGAVSQWNQNEKLLSRC